MLTLLQALIARVQAAVLTAVGLDIEAAVLARHAQRKAELLEHAAALEREGYADVAQELRQQAESLDLHRPLGGVLPAVAHLQAQPLALVKPDDNNAMIPVPEMQPSQPTSRPRKKGAKS